MHKIALRVAIVLTGFAGGGLVVAIASRVALLVTIARLLS
jgi:hypothetical protein